VCFAISIVDDASTVPPTAGAHGHFFTRPPIRECCPTPDEITSRRLVAILCKRAADDVRLEKLSRFCHNRH
jgi:hypothetical protein